MRSVVGLFWVLRQSAWDLIQFIKAVSEGSALKGLTDNSNHIQSASLDQSWLGSAAKRGLLYGIFFQRYLCVWMRAGAFYIALNLQLVQSHKWVGQLPQMPEISQLKGTLHKGEAGRVYITSDNYMCLKQGTLRAQSSATDCRHITGETSTLTIQNCLQTTAA